MTEASSSSSRKLILGGAAVVAVGVVVFAVLPAEFGIDPTGVGASLGLTQLSEEPISVELERGMKRTGVLELTDATPAPQPGLTDHWEVELAPFETIEFKYVVDEMGPIAFHWASTGTVKYDMHSHPFDGGVDLTESYGVDTAQSMQGIYNPAFTGIHGWYWENQTLEPVTLTLDASGSFTASKIFTNTGEYDRPVSGAEPTAEEAQPEA